MLQDINYKNIFINRSDYHDNDIRLWDFFDATFDRLTQFSLITFVIYCYDYSKVKLVQFNFNLGHNLRLKIKLFKIKNKTF